MTVSLLPCHEKIWHVQDIHFVSPAPTLTPKIVSYIFFFSLKAESTWWLPWPQFQNDVTSQHFLLCPPGKAILADYLTCKQTESSKVEETRTSQIDCFYFSVFCFASFETPCVLVGCVLFHLRWRTKSMLPMTPFQSKQRETEKLKMNSTDQFLSVPTTRLCLEWETLSDIGCVFLHFLKVNKQRLNSLGRSASLAWPRWYWKMSVEP